MEKCVVFWLKEKNIFFLRLFCFLKSLIYRSTFRKGLIGFVKTKNYFNALSLITLPKCYIVQAVYIFQKVVIKI